MIFRFGSRYVEEFFGIFVERNRGIIFLEDDRESMERFFFRCKNFLKFFFSEWKLR